MGKGKFIKAPYKTRQAGLKGYQPSLKSDPKGGFVWLSTRRWTQ